MHQVNSTILKSEIERWKMKPGRLNLLLYLALIALAAEVVFLVMQNRQLQARIMALTTPPATLKKGEKVAFVNLLSLSGTPEKLAFGAGMPSRLLFIFNTRCPACQKTLPIWQQLVTEMPVSVKIMGIANDSWLRVVSMNQCRV